MLIPGCQVDEFGAPRVEPQPEGPPARRRPQLLGDQRACLGEVERSGPAGCESARVTPVVADDLAGADVHIRGDPGEGRPARRGVQHRRGDAAALQAGGHIR